MENELLKQLLGYDTIEVHKIRGVTLIDHLGPTAAQVKNDDIPAVLISLSLLEATGKIRCIHACKLATVFERT